MTRVRRAAEAAFWVGVMLLVLVAVTRAGEICLVPSVANQRNITVDCNSVDPSVYDNAEFGIETTGEGLFHVGTNPRNGVLNAGTLDQPLFAVGGCPTPWLWRSSCSWSSTRSPSSPRAGLT